MNPVGLRLHLSPDVLSKLVTAVADRFRRFVRISRTGHAGVFYEVDLRILASYDAKEPKAGEGIHPTESVTVTREMVGELFDLLGLFPRSEQGVVGPAWPQGEEPPDSFLDLLEDIETSAISIEGWVGTKDIRLILDSIKECCKRLRKKLHLPPSATK